MMVPHNPCVPCTLYIEVREFAGRNRFPYQDYMNIRLTCTNNIKTLRNPQNYMFVIVNIPDRYLPLHNKVIAEIETQIYDLLKDYNPQTKYNKGNGQQKDIMILPKDYYANKHAILSGLKSIIENYNVFLERIQI